MENRATVSGIMAQPRPTSAIRKAVSTLFTLKMVEGVIRFWLKISRALLAMDCSPFRLM